MHIYISVNYHNLAVIHTHTHICERRCEVVVTTLAESHLLDVEGRYSESLTS